MRTDFDLDALLPVARFEADVRSLDMPGWRLDPMPFGSVKDSGLGREGPRSTIEEMTEPRMLVIAGL